MSDLHKRLEFASTLAYKAGEIMLKYFQIGIEQETKEDGSPVTIADKTINHMVIEKIAKHYPNDGVLGEEESLVNDSGEYLWECDPIDGTIPYSFGIPINMFTLALLQHGQPLLAVAYDPYMKRLFSAIKGEGAFCNGKAIHVNKTAHLHEAIVGVTGKLSNQTFDTLSFRADLEKAVSRELQIMSFSYEAVMVALGQLSAAVFPGVSAHDVGPVKLIVEEAGGKVTNLAGEEQSYDKPINGGILSNGLVHEQLVAIIKPHLIV